MKELKPDYPVFEAQGENEYPEEVIYDALMMNAEIHDREGRKYEFVGKYLEDNDFYQGLNMVSVIRNIETGVLYGYSWWNDISKYGSSMVESNGDEFGLECDTDADGFDWDSDYVSYYVWEPVEEYPIKAYRYV